MLSPACFALLFAGNAWGASPLNVQISRCEPEMSGTLDVFDPSSQGYGNSVATRQFGVRMVFAKQNAADDAQAALEMYERIELCLVNAANTPATVQCPGTSDWLLYDRTTLPNPSWLSKVVNSLSDVTESSRHLVNLEASAGAPDWSDSTQEQVAVWVRRVPLGGDVTAPPVFDLTSGACQNWRKAGGVAVTAVGNFPAREMAVFGVPRLVVNGIDLCQEGLNVAYRDGLCSDPAAFCGEQCLDVGSDPNNCGSCGNACAPGVVCIDGTCQFCDPTTTTCPTPAAPSDREHCMEDEPGEVLAYALASADGTQLYRFQGGLLPNDKLPGSANGPGPYRAFYGPHQGGGGVATQRRINTGSTFTFDPYSHPEDHRFRRLVQHEYYHSMQSHYNNAYPGLVNTAYYMESTAELMSHFPCFFDYPDWHCRVQGCTPSPTNDCTIPNCTPIPSNECVSDTRTLPSGQAAFKELIDNPSDGQLLLRTYWSQAIWHYIASHFGYLLDPDSDIHPGGIASTIPRYMNGDSEPLANRPVSDEGFDFFGHYLDLTKDESPAVGPIEGLRKVLPLTHGRSFDDILLDFHTAIYLKDYKDSDPRWHFDYAGSKGFKTDVVLNDYKPFPVPAGLYNASCRTATDASGTSQKVCDGFNRARRAYESHTSSTAFDPLGPGETVNSDDLGGPTLVGIYGANAVSVITDAALVGQSATVRISTELASQLRFRLFEVRDAGPSGDPDSLCGSASNFECLTPFPLCGDAPNFECELEEQPTNRRKTYSLTVPVTSSTRELILVASSRNQSACQLGVVDPELSNVVEDGAPASCEKFTWSIGAVEPTVTILEPTSGQPALAGGPGARRSFPVWFRVTDADGLGITVAPEQVSIRVPGCAAADCALPAENVTIVSGAEGTALATVTLPANFYPTGTGALDLEVSVDTIPDAAQELGSVVYSDAGHKRTLVMTLDKSGSMEGEKIEALRIVSRALVASLVPPLGEDPSARLGLVTFNQDADTDHAIDWLTADNVDEYYALLDLVAGGGTSIGDALLESQALLAEDRQQLVDANVPGTDGDGLVLLSDGVNQNESDPVVYYFPLDASPRPSVPTNDERGSAWYAEEPLPYALRKQEGLMVPEIQAIGIGQDADLSTMEKLATLSGGRPLTLEEDLGVLFEMARMMGAAFNEAQGLSTLGSSRVTDVTYFGTVVEPGARELRVIATAETEEFLEGEVQYVHPDGTVDSYQPSQISPDGLGMAFRIANPNPGNWRFARADIGGAVFVTFALDAEAKLFTFVDTGQLAPGQAAPERGVPVVIRAIPHEGTPVPGCDVTARVRRPGEVERDLVLLFDDGQGADELADDGIYSGDYRDTAPDGGYWVNITASCASPTSGEPFEREAETGFVLAPGLDPDVDEVPSSWEEAFGTDPDVADADADLDGDGLTGREEFELGTDPMNSDTDGGGESDAEVRRVTPGHGRGDPLDPSDDRLPLPNPEYIAGDEQVLINPATGLEGRTVEVQSAPTPEGPWTALDVDFVDGLALHTGLTNGELVCYRLRILVEVSGGQLASGWTVPQCARPGATRVPRLHLDSVDFECGASTLALSFSLENSDPIGHVYDDLDLGAVQSEPTEMRIWLGGEQPPATFVPFTTTPSIPIPAESPIMVHVQIRDEQQRLGVPFSKLLTCTTPAVNLSPDAGPDRIAECTGGSRATVILDGSASTGSGGPLEYAWTVTPPATVTSSDHAITAGTFPLGTHTATLTISEGAASAADSTQITVVDTTAPSLNVPPDVVTSSCTSVSLGQATATDGCGGSVTIVNDAPSSFKAGSYVVTWRAIDQFGNQSVKTQSVQVGLGDSSSCCPAGTKVIIGTSNNDVLTGTSGADCILGRGGQDTIKGAAGNDFLSGGDGNDVLEGAAGNDFIHGGTGQDTLRGQDGDDVLLGWDGDDSCYGGNQNDVIRGGQGQDHLYGDAGNDRLFGEIGDDDLHGGSGNDFMHGGGIHDQCFGDGGTDTYQLCENQASPPPPSGGPLSASFTVLTDWGSGYCVELGVTNPTATQTTNWGVTFNPQQATLGDTWNGTFNVGVTTVTVVPAQTWNRTIAPGATNNSVGLCLNRTVPGNSVATVTGTSATF